MIQWKISLQYFHRQCMNFKTVWLVLLLLVPMQSDSVFLQEKHLVWFNLTTYTIRDLCNTLLNYPKVGFATYFQTQSHSLDNKSIIGKKYFNFYQSSSQMVRTYTMVCQGSQSKIFCQTITKLHLYTDEDQLKQSISGYLSFFQNEKRIWMDEEYQLVFYQRSQQKEFLQFILVVIFTVLIIVLQFRFKQLKYLQAKFYLQLMTLCCMFVYEGCEFVKEAILNWHQKNHQLWFLLPLSLISYKILESLVQRFMYNLIPMKIWLPCLLFNCFLVYFAQQLPFFDFICCVIIMFCKIQNQNENQFSLSSKINKRKIERNIVRGYLVINFALIFKKLWIYSCLYVNPFFIIIRVIVLLCFFAVYLHKSREEQRREKMIATQFTIKIIQTQNELIEELSLDLSCTIEQECAICYQKIVCRWAKTPCGHVFHDDCLYKWLDKSETCPIDRRRAISDKNLVFEKQAQILNE